MKRERKMLTPKNKTKLHKKNKMKELSNLMEKEFKIMVIKIFTGIERKIEELREDFDK